jgi:hypothetical protein
MYMSDRAHIKQERKLSILNKTFLYQAVIFIILLSGLLSSCLATPVPATVSTGTQPVADETVLPAAGEPLRITIGFTPSEKHVQNPERGLAGDAELDDPDYSQYYQDEYTIVYMDVRLDDYREIDLPREFLDEIDAWFSSMRQGGVKAIVRFSYNDGPYPDPEPDASLDQILRHIQQVEPLLKKNSDVIAWVEAGFIGAWGEWHASTNGLDDDMNAKRTILFSLLDAVPADRMVLLRYPVDIMTIFPNPLSRDEAFSGTYQSRVGFHNDCFLSSFDDEHTYGRDGVFSVDSEISYLAQISQYVPVGGESCAYNPPRSDCPKALDEIARLHFTQLSDGWHPDVLDAWAAQGCYEEIQDRLGYRFSLVSMTFNESVRPGGVLNVEITLKNSGFASLINPRYVYAILDGPAHFETVLDVDPRFWASGELSLLQMHLRLPATAPEGTYKLALWLPDSAVTLRNDSRYAIRFANDDVWDEKTGYNILTEVDVNSQGNGVVDPAATEFILLP